MADEAILRAIPHRPPFLFLDELIEVTDERVVARKYVDPNEAYFAGHYPDRPIMPGVLICESAFQAGAVLLAHRVGPEKLATHIPVLARIKEARFSNMVLPGQTMDITADLDDTLAEAFYMIGRVKVDAKQVLYVAFACMLKPREEKTA